MISQNQSNHSFEICGPHINMSRKFEFYNQLKIKFGKESYLDHINDFNDKANLNYKSLKSQF